MQYQTPVYNGVLRHDTSNSPNMGVIRNSDNSVNVGVANVNGVNNSGGVVESGIQAFATSGNLLNTTRRATTAGTLTLTLPPISAATGQSFSVSKTDATTTLTIAGSSSDKIAYNAAPASTISVTAQGLTIEIWNDGTNWYAK